MDLVAEADVVWMTTVGAGGQPQSSPVWSVWYDERLLVLSEPHATKVANVARTPLVAMHLNGGAPGTTVVTLEGRAELVHPPPPAAVVAYRAKYAAGFTRIGTTADAYL